MGTVIKISVVIPAYNREKTIERCVRSVLSQNIPVHEIIVVDDGSSDKTIETTKSIADDRITVINQNHKGAQAARNLGALKATGTHIAFLDSDDEWLPGFVEHVSEWLKKAPEEIVYTNCIVIQNGRHEIWRCSTGNGDIYKTLLVRPGPMFNGMVIKKESLLSIGLLDENVPSYQEWDTAIRLAKKGFRFRLITKPLFIYYRGNNDTISTDLKRQIRGYSYVVHKFEKDIERECGKKELAVHYLRLLRWCFKWKDKDFFRFCYLYCINR